jgi:hypothetical protein
MPGRVAGDRAASPPRAARHARATRGRGGTCHPRPDAATWHRVSGASAAHGRTAHGKVLQVYPRDPHIDHMGVAERSLWVGHIAQL